MTFSFSGPSLSTLPASLAGAFLVGNVLVSAADMDSAIVGCLVWRAAADFAIYHFFKDQNQIKSPKALAELYCFTNLTVNVATLQILRFVDVIGPLGTAVYVSFICIEFFTKCLNFSKFRDTPDPFLARVLQD